MQPNSTIQREIESALSSTCQRNQLRLLHACESGSRAWGFASPDSDFDVRFIYCREASEYLRVFEPRDCIEAQLDGDIDLSGWDLRKTLRLVAKSNAVVLEWLQSPIVYGGESQVQSLLWSAAQEYFAPKSCIHHYLGTVRSSLATIDSNSIGIKKCFYVLRPLLAAYWISERLTVPPMEFRPLRVMLDRHPEIQSRVDRLLEEKANAPEKHRIAIDRELTDFIASIQSLCENAAQKLTKKTLDSSRLDEVFKQVVDVIP